MAIQFRIDSITVDGDIVRFQIGPYGFEKDKTWFFDTSSFDPDHMRKNMRLAYHIGTKPDIASREFLDTVNSRAADGGLKGMDLGGATWFIRAITLAPGSKSLYTIGFSGTRTGPVTLTLDVDREEIERSTSENPEDIFDNVKSFLRLGKFTDFTPQAIAQLKARLFWA